MDELDDLETTFPAPRDMQIQTPTDAATAVAFIREIASHGYLFHPEDRARDCFPRQPAELVAALDEGMRATWRYLPDPCEVALAIGEDLDADPIITVHVTRYIAWQGPASEAHKARAW